MHSHDVSLFGAARWCLSGAVVTVSQTAILLVILNACLPLLMALVLSSVSAEIYGLLDGARKTPSLCCSNALFHACLYGIKIVDIKQMVFNRTISTKYIEAYRSSSIDDLCAPLLQVLILPKRCHKYQQDTKYVSGGVPDSQAVICCYGNSLDIPDCILL